MNNITIQSKNLLYSLDPRLGKKEKEREGKKEGRRPKERNNMSEKGKNEEKENKGVRIAKREQKGSRRKGEGREGGGRRRRRERASERESLRGRKLRACELFMNRDASHTAINHGDTVSAIHN